MVDKKSKSYLTSIYDHSLNYNHIDKYQLIVQFFLKACNIGSPRQLVKEYSLGQESLVNL